MLVKKGNFSCAFSWSPIESRQCMMAAGSIAGTMTDDFSASALLSIYSFDLYDDDVEFSSHGRIDVAEKFHKLAWTSIESYPLGILGGALVDGSVKVWNPATIIGETGGDECVCSIEAHENDATNLQFNPVHKHLLATTGHDNAIRIWSLQNPTQPNLSMTPTDSKNHLSGNIKGIQWHPKLSHILGCCTTGGSAHIWDLKAKRCTSSFTNGREKGPMNCMAWNPDNPTQLAVAIDASTPIIDIWDLRKAVAPIHSMSAHSDSVLSLSWCPSDRHLLLSCGADGKTICWNPTSGKMLNMLDDQSNWIIDVQWSPFNANLFATSNYENNFAVFSLSELVDYRHESCISLPSSTTSVKRPCTLTSSFTGRLYTVRNDFRGERKDVLLEFQLTNDADISDIRSKGQLLRAFLALQDLEKGTRGKFVKELVHSDAYNLDEDLAYSILCDVSSVEFQERPGETVETLLRETSRFSSSSQSNILIAKEVAIDQNSDIIAISDLVLKGKIDPAIAKCIEDHRFDDAFMMLPFASLEMQDVLYDRYSTYRQQSFFVRALNAVRMDNVIACVSIENLQITDWQDILLFGLNYCDASVLDELYCLLSKKLESIVVHDVTHNTNPSFHVGLITMLTLSKRWESLLHYMLAHALFSTNPDEMKNFHKRLLNGSWTDSTKIVASRKILLEVFLKALGFRIAHEICDMPDIFFTIAMILTHSLCASGLVNDARDILVAAVGTSNNPQALSADREKCCTMLARVEIAIEYKASKGIGSTVAVTSKRDKDILEEKMILEKQLSAEEDFPHILTNSTNIVRSTEDLDKEVLAQDKREPPSNSQSSQTLRPPPLKTEIYETSSKRVSAHECVEQSISAMEINGRKARSPVEVHQADARFENIEPQSIEHQIIRNFTILLEEVTDERRKESIKKSLDTLFQLLNERSLDDGLIQKLYRFTQTSKSSEGKDLIRVMGMDYWSSFRKFLNIKFL